MKKDVLDKQCGHWNERFSTYLEMFGSTESETARIARDIFVRQGVDRLLELGGGQGRDTIYFACNGFSVDVLEYAESALNAIIQSAGKHALTDRIAARRYDLRDGLPFLDGSFDACYAHQVLCMALTEGELEFLVNEVRRVLKKGGIFLYTVRNTEDPHYGQGIHRGEDLYETGGFIVHFFSREKVEKLAHGFEIIKMERAEKSRLPRRLFRVTLRKT
ncbi:MAG TPA: class I SAM-dependent methyltransferase [Syntrophorhabdaceae bacterium]|nr:class I SAM-dependent methyltransferase [Syntrophorhabdaceae bacterium]